MGSVVNDMDPCWWMDPLFFILFWCVLLHGWLDAATHDPTGREDSDGGFARKTPVPVRREYKVAKRQSVYLKSCAQLVGTPFLWLHTKKASPVDGVTKAE